MNSITTNRLPIDPNLKMKDVVRDPNIDLALKMASDIYTNEVKGFYNHTPYFSDTTSEEKRYIYILARALGLFSLKKIEADKECDDLRASLQEMVEYASKYLYILSLDDNRQEQNVHSKIIKAKELLEEKKNERTNDSR